MAFRQRDKTTGRESASAAVPPAAPLAGRPCGGLARALARTFKEPKPEILDIGPLCGESIVYLAGRGARVHVEEFDPPPPVPPRRAGEPPPAIPPLRFDQPDGFYHLVLAWEVADFVPPERLSDYGAELRRVLRDGGMIFFLSHMKPESETDSPARYLLLADDLIVRQPSDKAPRRRWAHATRDIERALAGFAIQGIQLQRTQMREISAVKTPLG